MATKVQFTAKDGSTQTLIFGKRSVAEAYAKTVKDAVLVDSDASAPEVEVKACPAGTPEAQKASTNNYFRDVNAAKRGYVVEPATADDAEAEFERMSEHFGAARLAGQPMAEAFSDWDFINSRRQGR